MRNLGYILKAAEDLFSVEGLLRSVRVADELRQQRLVDRGLDDVLQLPVMLWHAWVSLCRLEGPTCDMEAMRTAAQPQAEAQAIPQARAIASSSASSGTGEVRRKKYRRSRGGPKARLSARPY